MSFSIRIAFKVTTSAGVAVTGKAGSSFAASTLWQGGSNITDGSNTVVVSELALGHYEALVTVASALDTQLIISSDTDADYIDGSIRSNCVTITAKQLAALDRIGSGVMFCAAGSTTIDSGIVTASTLFLPLVYVFTPGGTYPSEGQMDLTGVLSVNRIRDGVSSSILDGGDADYLPGVAGWDADLTGWLPGDIYIIILLGLSATVDGITSGCPAMITTYTVSRESAIEADIAVVDANVDAVLEDTIAIQASIATASIGEGTYSLTVPVIDGSGVALPGATVQVRNTSGTILSTSPTRTSDGKAHFMAGDGTYRLYPSKAGYSYAVEAGYVEVTVDGANIESSAITLTALSVSAATGTDRCRLYVYADDAAAAASTLTGTAQPFHDSAHPKPQFVDATGTNLYTGLTNGTASLTKSANGLFYFDELKQGAYYSITISSMAISSGNNVVLIPSDFTGGTDKIAYLVQELDGTMSVTVTPPS